MQKLVLSARPGNWKAFMARKSDSGFLAFAQKVHQRDNYTCQYCGFQARDYQEVVNRDQDYRNNKLSNMLTACVLCAQCFFLDSVGIGDYGGGTLIYLPELSQEALNSLCHVVFCAFTNDTGYKATAQNIYRTFKFGSQAVEQHFGEGTSIPAVMGQLMIDADTRYAPQFDTALRDIRLLPSRSAFKMQIEHWAETAFQELTQDD